MSSTGKVLSMRELGKKQNFAKSKNQLNFLKFNPLSLSLLSFAILAEIYIIAKYFGKDITANFSILLLVLGTIALFGMLWINEGKFLIYELPFLGNWKQGLKYIVGIATLMAIIGFMMMFFKATFRYALKLVDTYFYYLAAAVIEEAFFRMLLISYFMTRKRIPNRFIGLILGVMTSSFFFMIAHWSVYGHSIPLMSAMFFGALLYSAYYLAFQDITITMLGHLLINFITVFMQISTGLMVVG